MNEIFMRAFSWFVILLLILTMTSCNYISIKDSTDVHIELQDEYRRDGNTDANLGLK